MLFDSVNRNLSELSSMLLQLPDTCYSMPRAELSHSSIGEHVRHIIELYECLLLRYDEGIVNYDLRKRDKAIQASTQTAIERITGISGSIKKDNKPMVLQQQVNGEIMEFESNYYRELLYNFEHTIHHQALIKVALLQLKEVSVAEDFGVAPSTIEYRKNVYS
ncbi:hypothetical protein CHU92_03740 [Flavobacterium cyanobacteriorum]|uniref:DinB family protein n=1 Tax=Flavobacterium cyanobacteriorum TaxID=2022802 RepID=A0A255ZNG0_9FLAO|nr:hypothetical protein [Flavobacterium cyanobacteriorum]OYQ43038.1 hypothetical protein CHU92_03740 [Flavobacterium cyanobacteriorum]